MEACYGVALGLLWSFCYALLYHANPSLPSFLSLSLAYFPLSSLVMLELHLFYSFSSAPFFLPSPSVSSYYWNSVAGMIG